VIAFDHIAIGAATLEAGAAAVAAALGGAMGPGGRHPQMGTWNRLSATGPDTFLEVIAVDPEAAAPGRARWFGLDDPAVAARIAAKAQPVGLVARTFDLDGALARSAEAGFDLGRPVEASRGDLRWRFAVRDDGAVPEGGAAPLLIEWPAGPHPAGRMQDAGLRYAGLTLRGPDRARLRRLMAALGAEDMAEIETGAPGIAVALTGPGGRRARFETRTETQA
jgi:hypothetical protein